MKAKNVLAAAAGGFFLVAFLRNGTAAKAVKQAGNLAQTFTSGSAKLSRRI